MNYRLIMGFSLLPTVLAIQAAYAQDTVELETVEVAGQRNAARYQYTASPQQSQSATKTATLSNNVPQSVSVVTRRHLDERDPKDMAETLVYTAGASGGYRGENGIIEMSVRGIGFKSGGGGQPTFLDGLRYPASLEISPYAVDRIEVLKGPSSVLYGQANPGGLVNISFKEASGSNENEIMFKTGTGKLAEVGVDLDRAVNDEWAYRIVGDAKQVNWQAGDVARQRSLTLAPSLRWKPNEQTEWTLKAFYERQPEAGDRNFLVRQGTVDAVEGSYIPYDFFAGDKNFHNFNNRKAHIGHRFSHDFGNGFSVEQNLRYGQYSDDWKTLVVWYAGEGSELIRKARRFEDSSRDLLVDNRLRWQGNIGSVKHDALFGLDYADRRADLKAWLGNAPSIDWRSPVYGVSVEEPPLTTDETTKIKQTGVYVQDQIQWGNWHFLAGGRYDRVRRNYRDDLYGKSQLQSDGKFTWRTGVLYAFSNGLSPYMSYSTSFLPEAGAAADGSMLKPTTARQWEAGLKYQPNPSFSANAALFDIEQKNLTVYTPLTYEKTQRGKVRTRGAEIEIQGDITPAWGISGNYTYLDKKVREDSDASAVGTTSWGVPKHSFSLWTDYRFSGVLSGVSAGLGLRHISKTWGDNANTFRVPAYTLWDMKLAYKPGEHWRALKGTQVQLNVQNLTNKEYVASCANDNACFYGKGRVVTLSAGYRW